jgi:uncharacterized protein YejL (UPF0352 family)
MKNKSLSAFNNIPRQAAIGGHPYGSDRGMGALGNVISGAPRQAELMDQPHMLAYINPQEEQMLRDAGGAGIPGPDGIPVYGWWSDTWKEVTSGGKADTETYNSGDKTTTTPTTTTNTTTNTSDDDPGFFGDGGTFENWFDTNIYDVDGDQSGGGSNDNTVVTTNNNDSNNGLTNYTSMYDAIDAQGVGATVMINGVTMAAVAADGYIGNGQYDTTSSGATSGYTTDYADDTIVSTNTGQGYLDADGKFIQYGALDFDEDYTPTKEELDAAIAAAGGVNLTDDQYAETVDFTTTTSGNDYVDAAEDDGVTDEQLDDGNGGDDDTIVSTGTGQGYLDADGKFIQYGTDLVDDTELTDEDILMNMPVNVDTTNLNDFIILTQDGTNGNPITPVEIGQTITSDGGKQVTLPEGIGAVVGEGGTRLIDETTGEVIGFLPNKTVQSSDGVLRFTIYNPSTQALIDNAIKILTDQVNNDRFFAIAKGIEIADPNRDYSVGGGDQNKGDLGFIFGKYKLPDGVEVSIVTQAEYDALVKKWGATVVENALVKTESDETNLSAFDDTSVNDTSVNGTSGGGTSGGDTSGDSGGGGDIGGIGGDIGGDSGGDIGGDSGGDSGGEDGTGVDGTGVDGTGVALTSEQVSTIVTDALALLPDYATPTDVSTAITTALEGMNDLSPEDVTNAITTALAGQKNLSDDDVETIINSTVGSPSTTTVIDGVEVVTDATGIYAQIEDLNNLSTDDVSTIVTDALALLPAYATPTDVTNAITTALEGQNNLSPEDVTNAITTALEGMNNLSDEDVTTIVGDAISGLNNLSTTDVSTIVTDALDLLPDYATPTDVTNAITTALEGMNDLSPEDVTNAITTALADMNDLSDDDVGDIITKIVGSPSTTTVIDGIEVVTDPTGIYAKIEGLNNLSTTDVSTIVTDALNLLPEYATPTDVTNAITTALEGMNDLSPEDVTTAITNALAGMNNLSDEDVGDIITKIVGQDAQPVVDENGDIVVDADGNPVYSDPTGIYAKIEGLNNLSTTDVSTIVTDALALLPEYATPTDVSTAITNALEGMNNLSDKEVSTIVTDALSGMNNLSDEDVTTIVGDAISKLNNLSTDDVSTIVTDALADLPEYATPTDVSTAITNALEGMNNLSDEDVTTIVTDALSGMNNLSDDDVSKIVGDAISGLNNISTEDVEGIVSDAISGLNDLSDEEVGDIITKTVGSPSTTTVMDDGTEVVTDATGIYAKIQGLNNLSTDDLSTAINDAIDELPDYATPADVTSAITTAVAALTTGALKTMQDTIDEMGRYETSEDFSVRDIVEEFKRQRKGGMGYGLPSYMQRYMSGNVIDELVREVVLPDGSKFFVTPDGRYLDPEEFIGSKTTGGVQYVSTGDDRYQSGYSTLDTKTGVKTNYDMDGKVIGTSVQPESTLAS